ncbi:uncharacterized protein [Procambarus clarkii]|uniref:uncharacterized protein isoform X1 n=1 Tax=Procambarus clarkii TaxID=6728 RepID=UPI003743FF80
MRNVESFLNWHMVCLPFKPAAGTNVPANIRIVDEAHTKMLWKVLATELQENTCRSTVKVIMMHGMAWSEAPLLCKRKSTKVIVSGVVLAFWIFCSSRSICPTT